MVSNLKEDVITVPYYSVYREDGQTYVYVVSEGAKIKTYVEIGIEGTMYTEIISGIEEGAVIYEQY